MNDSHYAFKGFSNYDPPRRKRSNAYKIRRAKRRLKRGYRILEYLRRKGDKYGIEHYTKRILDLLAFLASRGEKYSHIED